MICSAFLLDFLAFSIYNNLEKLQSKRVEKRLPFLLFQLNICLVRKILIMEDNIKKEKKSNLKNIITIENLLCFLIIICPILDAASFLFRNYFNTNISISTFIRPIIPIIAITYIFVIYFLKIS